MRTISIRLRRGDDLLVSIRETARKYDIAAGVVLSAVGCVSRAHVRDASGVTMREIEESCEIVSMMGTVSKVRCHLHIALAREDLSVVGGHLSEGCIVNTTCEHILGVPDDLRFDTEQDASTGYDEIVFLRR